MKSLRCLLTDNIPYDEALALWACCARRDVFNHPGCWRALVESGVHPGRVVCLEVRSSNGDLAAVWPFIIKRGGAKDLFARIVEPLGAHYLDYILPIVGQRGDQQVLATLLEGVGNLLSSTGRMRLPKIPLDDKDVEAYNRIDELAWVKLQNVRSSPCLRFGKSYEETERFWGKSHRPIVRRKLRYLEREGDVELWITQDKEEILSRLPVLFDLHRKKWKGQGEPSQFELEADRIVFQLLVEQLPNELLHYSELRIDNRQISCHFGFLMNGWLYWYKPAFDPAYYNLSPGLSHIALLVRYGVDHGLIGIDFLQGDEEYKFRWANDSKETSDHILAMKRGAPWWVWETQYRDDVRKLYCSLRKKLMSIGSSQ